MTFFDSWHGNKKKEAMPTAEDDVWKEYNRLVTAIDSGKFFDGNHFVERALHPEEVAFLEKHGHEDVLAAARGKGLIFESAE